MPHVSPETSRKQVAMSPQRPKDGSAVRLEPARLSESHAEHGYSILLEFFHADSPGTSGRTGHVLTFDAAQRVLLACSPVDGPLTPMAVARAAFNGLGLPSHAAVNIVIECDFLVAAQLALELSALMPRAGIDVRSRTSMLRSWAERQLVGRAPSVPTSSSTT